MDNLGLAIKIALDQKVSPKIIERTIPKIIFEGRLQYIEKGKLHTLVNKNEKILLDGAHSNTSAQNLYNYLKTLNVPIYCIWGMQKNKIPNEFLKNFKGIFNKVITIKIPNEKNACSAIELKNIASRQNYNVDTAKNIKDSLKKLYSKEKKIIVFMGSLYWIGYVLKNN